MGTKTSNSERPSCIFHYPHSIASEGQSGSQVRPFKITKALSQIGFDVHAITGTARERSKQIERLTREIELGRQFRFLYAESHTMPTLLTDPHHLPLHPRQDFAFFRRVSDAGIPIGLFYRDMFWRFRQHTFKSPIKRHYSAFFYWHDWRQYLKLVDHLFLPSSRMAEHLPTPWPKEVSALPPGADQQLPRASRKRREPSPLRLFYVGGVTPPLYDLTPLFDFVRDMTSVEVTLCCRPQEWQGVKDNYHVPPNVRVVHASGAELAQYYEWADLFAILWKPATYLDFAMPVKIFESISYGLPIVITEGSEAARFIAEEGLGWVVDSKDGFRELLNRLCHDHASLQARYERVAEAASQHSWQARAREIAQTLSLEATEPK